ncbi:MAG: hypothetical protein V2B20_25685, partial [Pseudomonadota bacterium]
FCGRNLSAILPGESGNVGTGTGKQPPDRFHRLYRFNLGCLRIGFFGLTTRPFGIDGGQHDGPVYANLPALEIDIDYIGIAKRIIAEYRQEVDVPVLVSHLGLIDDIAVAEQTNGLGLILGGHSHNSAQLSTGTEGDGDGGEKGPEALLLLRHDRWLSSGRWSSPWQATSVLEILFLTEKGTTGWAQILWLF